MKWRQDCLCPICLFLAFMAHAQAAQEETPLWQASPPPATTTFNGDLAKTLDEWRQVAQVFLPSSLDPNENGAAYGGKVELKVSDAQAMVFYRYGF